MSAPGAAVRIRHFTDPGCPWAFSAEPYRWRLEWLYGDGLGWELVMVGLSDDAEAQVRSGFTAEMLAAGFRQLQGRFGMPIDWTGRPRPPATVPACRLVVAARLDAPEREGAVLRRLRVLAMAGGMLDDEALMRRAAEEAGLDGDELLARAADDDVAEALAEDMRAARAPGPAARALDHKLGGPDEERRYTCPSYVLRAGDGDGAIELPGFQPPEAYEAAIANLAPELARRDAPESAAEVLAWAGEPLATVEVAAVMGAEPVVVRTELARHGAVFVPAGPDGYWSLG